MDCTINTVLCLPNLPGLTALAALRQLGAHRWKVSVVEPKGLAAPRARDLVPHPELAAAAIREAFLVARAQAHPPRELVWDGLPCCALPEAVDALRTMPDFDIVAMVEANEVSFHPVDYLNACRLPACNGCAQERCLGWWCGAWELHPDFRPRPLAPSTGDQARSERRGS